MSIRAAPAGPLLCPDHGIIDAHLHLTDPARLSYPWMAHVPALQRHWTLADYDRMRGGVDVRGMVFVEVDVAPDQTRAEAAMVAGVATTDPRLIAMVAAVPMDRGEATQTALAEMRGFPLLRGIRHLIQGHAATPGWACRLAMIEGVRSLAQHGLSFDICIVHSQMPDAVALVRACPQVTFVLDHLGKPGLRAGVTPAWFDDLAALAALPNVVCKISGLATEADHAGWTEDQMLPCLTHALSVFGGDRVMFGSDWPVCELAIALPVWVDMVHRAAAPFGDAFASRLWQGTARQVYRLP